MLPVYRFMDSNPHQRNQMPITQYYHPSLEAVPPQMRRDSAKFPVSYESWPYGGNHGYPIPCHACCNHSYFPGYYSCRPPIAHLSPPLPFHYHGSHPAFPEVYPVQYVPPPHSSMDQPRYYEYDKNEPGYYHCCGCPNHLGNWKEDKNVKPFESEVKDKDEVPRDRNPPESSNSLEPMWNGWFPLDMNSLGSLKQGGDGKRTQNWQDGDKVGQFPFPIIWMPSYDKPEEVEMKDHYKSNAAPKSAEEPPSNFKVIPLKHPDSDDSMKRPIANEENSGDEVGSKMMEKSANRKGIPVKQMERHGETKTTSEDGEGKARDTPVKHVEDNGTKKPSESSSAKRQSSSPPKMSKLPPVCLRVDPLPRRKNGNGSSRSPSPPGPKGNSQEILNEKSKASASTGLKENTQHDSQALNCEAKEEKSEVVFKAEEKNLSDAEAAVIIQSAYRGFEVRKWEPLKKLKQIAKVREQVVEVRSRVQALESSSDIWRDERQRVIIGETIMSLLLKLDTIQGLHPSLRDIRKSVARELTSLQEKLDSLTIPKSEELIEELSTAKLEKGCVDTHNSVCMQGGQDKEAKEVGTGYKYSESSCDNSSILIEPHQGHPPHMTDAVSEKHGQIELRKDEVLQGGVVEQTETGKIVVLHGGEVESNVEIGVASSNDEALDMNKLEQQPREALEEGPLVAELEDFAKIDEEILGDSKLKLKVVQPQGEDVSHDNELAKISEAEAAQLTFSVVDKESHDEEQEGGQGISNVDQTASSGPTNTVVTSQEEEVPFEEVVTSHEEEVPIEETKRENLDQPVTIGEKERELPDGEDVALAGTQFAPAGAERGEEEEELFPDSSTVSEVCVEENVTESDKKLMEENEKLREMMEKLIEAGKEQLIVIANLSGRVKDLERKLSRKKKLRTRRCRAQQHLDLPSSCMAASN